VVALTAQNTTGVKGVHPVPVDFVHAQIEALAQDLPPVAVKTGMLATRALVETVASLIALHRWDTYVLDPVMVATSGHRLLEPDAEDAVRRLLIPRALLVTPNLDEAEILAGFPVRDVSGMERAGRVLLDLGARAALMKGGHLGGATLVDLLVTPEASVRFERPRIDTTSTHGTGCTLSAAVTAGLAFGRSLDQAVADGLDFVARAIAEAPGLGSGHGPLSHFVPAPT
jgi:hydroxymethylpyrimidine/phosphomethylpyrimidine kinase